MTTKLMYRVQEAAEKTSLSRSRLFVLMGTGEIESVKCGGVRLIPAEALEAFVERLRAEAAGEAESADELVPDQAGAADASAA